MPTDTFLTLSGPGTAELRIRGSSFIAAAAPSPTEEAARDFIAGRSRQFHDATHNCTAWRLRDGRHRTNDDGEPGGSAGAPILAAVEGAGLVDCVVVVTRYFGGTKLGVGGLVRAYGEAAAAALAAAPRRAGVRAMRVRVAYAYAHTAAVMRMLELAETYEVEHGYAAGGREGEVRVAMPTGAVEAVERYLSEATAGEVALAVLEQCIVYTGG